jgi:Bacteriodetes cell division protein (FtsL-like)
MSIDDKNKNIKSTFKKVDFKRFFNYKWVIKNMQFFFFLAFLAVLYIYNGHYTDKLARKIATTEKHIKELEYEYKTIKSEVIYRSKASELANAVANLGLQPLTTPPLILNDSMQ